MSGPLTPDLCPMCRGERGRYVEVVVQITREMAMDAGDLNLEGEPWHWGDEWRECPECGGTGGAPSDDSSSTLLPLEEPKS